MNIWIIVRWYHVYLSLRRIWSHPSHRPPSLRQPKWAKRGISPEKCAIWSRNLIIAVSWFVSLLGQSQGLAAQSQVFSVSQIRMGKVTNSERIGNYYSNIKEWPSEKAEKNSSLEKEIKNELRLTVSTRYVQQILSANPFLTFKILKKQPQFLPKHKQVRSEWARERNCESPSQWRRRVL